MVKALEANGFFDDKFSHQKRDKVPYARTSHAVQSLRSMR
jgi:hypothetical protein